MCLKHFTFCTNFNFRINPVTGLIVEPSQVSPFEGMTEEQKEYEANRLANLMHKLSDLGVVKPGKIGPNGTNIYNFRIFIEKNNTFFHFRHSYFC